MLKIFFGGERLLKGTVKRWLEGKGYGFIQPDEGEKDIFVHNSELKDMYLLEEGQRVEFDVEDTYKGPRANNVRQT